jgi:VCBS repeat-containing protein
MVLQFSYHKTLDQNYKVLTADEYFNLIELNELTFVATKDDVSIGFIRGRYVPESIDRTGSYAYLLDIFVEPTYRKMNVGTQLCDTFFQKASELGAKNVELAVDIQNTQAKNFWEKLNFKTIQLRMRRFL